MKRAIAALFLLSLMLLTICGLAAAIPGCAAADHLADQVLSATTPTAPGKAPTTAQAIVAGVEVAAGGAAAAGNPAGVVILGSLSVLTGVALAYQKFRNAQQIQSRDARLAAYRESFSTLAEAGVLTADMLDKLHPDLRPDVPSSPPATSPTAATSAEPPPQP
jgi:hypothetical protein